MIGKLITKGKDRKVAMRKMRAALKGLVLKGLKTNIPLHKVILDEERFVGGNYTTKYLEEVDFKDKVTAQFTEELLVKEVVALENSYLESH
jgi:biotin carboxylase